MLPLSPCHGSPTTRPVSHLHLRIVPPYWTAHNVNVVVQEDETLNMVFVTFEFIIQNWSIRFWSWSFLEARHCRGFRSHWRHGTSGFNELVAGRCPSAENDTQITCIPCWREGRADGLSVLDQPGYIWPLGEIATPQTILVCLVDVAIAAKWSMNSMNVWSLNGGVHYQTMREKSISNSAWRAISYTSCLMCLSSFSLLDLGVDGESWCLMTCLKRIQDLSKQQVPSIGTRLRRIYVQEGVKAVFAGVIPRTIWISAGGSSSVYMDGLSMEWALERLISFCTLSSVIHHIVVYSVFLRRGDWGQWTQLCCFMLLRIPNTQSSWVKKFQVDQPVVCHSKRVTFSSQRTRSNYIFPSSTKCI